MIAAPYAHATAPLRRLADRYVLDLACELEDGAPSPATLAALPALAEVMERAETMAAGVDRAAIDLVEAVILRDRVGEVFRATVVDRSGDRTRIQLADPPVRASVAATRPRRARRSTCGSPRPTSHNAGSTSPSPDGGRQAGSMR